MLACLLPLLHVCKQGVTAAAVDYILSPCRIHFIATQAARGSKLFEKPLLLDNVDALSAMHDDTKSAEGQEQRLRTSRTARRAATHATGATSSNVSPRSMVDSDEAVHTEQPVSTPVTSSNVGIDSAGADIAVTDSTNVLLPAAADETL